MRLGVRKFNLDLQPHFQYNIYLDSREGLNEYQTTLLVGARSVSAAHPTTQQLDCNYLCG